MSSIRHPALALAFALTGLARAQTTWYVDISVAGPGTGTALDPFRTIKYAVANAPIVDGDTVLVAPGAYPQSFAFGARITIRSTGGPLVTSLGPGAAADAVYSGSYGIYPQVAQLEGFTVYGTVHANDATVRRCILIGGGGFGLKAIDFIYAEHCTVVGYDTGGSGVLHGANVYFHNSIVYDSYVNDIGLGAATYTWYGTQDQHPPTGLGPPGFFDPASNDLHLLASSPCRDAGDPNSPLDPDGTLTDLGALPFDAGYQPFSAYCTAKLNSAGCLPSIGALNSPSLSSPNPFTVRCTNELNQKNGFLFYGFAPKNTPYQGGYLCVQAPTQRTPLQNSGGNVGPDDCSGTFAFDFRPLLHNGSNPALALGTQVFCQYWARDPAASFATNRSNALRFTLQP